MTDAIQREFPFSQQIRQDLESLQQSLELRGEDIARVEQPLIQQAELRYQEKLRQESEQQRQEQEKVEYESKLRRYEQEFTKAIQAEYPLNQSVLGGLKAFQQQLGLKNESVAQIEQPIREPAEAKYQENLKRQAEAERQQQIELEQQRQIKEQPRQAEAKHKAQGQVGTRQVSSSQKKAASRLQRFEFDVIRVNKKGEENSRTKKTAEFFAEDLGHGVLLEMVKIPSGTFQMGSPAGQGTDDEKPQHAVTVPAFLMGKYPITQVQWRTVAALPQVETSLNADHSYFKGDSRPVEGVSWDEAVEFCQRLSIITGHLYRLPSEAEWEYACRAGTTTEFYFGETLTPKLAHCKDNFGMVSVTLFAGETASVGSYLPNAFGLYDMHGNVAEWCADHWHGDYAGAPTDGTAWFLDGWSERRIYRGGSWSNNQWGCRAARSSSYPHATRSNDIGFRVVCSVFPGLL